MKINEMIARFPHINPVGLVAGTLMLILPFIGAWWEASVGESALEIAFSPFFYQLSLAGVDLTSSLVGYFMLATRLTVLGGGGMMIVGSLRADRWWGDKILRWGAMKVVWLIISMVGLVVVGALLMNEFLPSILSGFIDKDVSMSFGLPYLIGSGKASISFKDSVNVTAPVTTSLTSSFFLAVLTGGLGVVTKIYQNRVEKENVEEPGGDGGKSKKGTDEKHENSDEQTDNQTDEKSGDDTD